MDELICDINSRDIVDGVKLRAAEDSNGNVTLEMISISPKSTYVQDIDLNFNIINKTVDIASYASSAYFERTLSADAFIVWAKAAIELAERIKGDNSD